MTILLVMLLKKSPKILAGLLMSSLVATAAAQDMKNDSAKSESKDEALLSLGIQYLSVRDIEAAESTLTKLVKRTDSKFFLQAHYYLGWCAVNNRNFKKAFKHFELIARQKKPVWAFDSQKSEFTSRNLRDEALDGLVFCYPDAKPGSRALEYFSKFKLNRKQSIRVFEKLANRYYILEEFQAALPLYKHLLHLCTNPEDLKEYKSRIKYIKEALDSTSR